LSTAKEADTEGETKAEPGELVDVTIPDAKEYDLIGKSLQGQEH
jgi:hypothetical protein